MEYRREADIGEHIIISGTGRAGTTLLVQYFTAMGLDTGFNISDALGKVDGISKAGLEFNLRSANLPRIAKSPWFADSIEDVLAEGGLKILAAIVPMRNLFGAAESRRRVYRESAAAGLDPLTHPGTIWKTEDPSEQEIKLSLQYYKLMESLVRYAVPIYHLPFPEFARDHNVLWTRLQPLLLSEGVTKESSLKAFESVVDVNLIHDFDRQIDAEKSSSIT